MKKFEVKIYYSGYCSHEVKAKSKNEAVVIARKLALNKDEILSNLENWKEADEAFEIKKLKDTEIMVTANTI